MSEIMKKKSSVKFSSYEKDFLRRLLDYRYNSVESYLYTDISDGRRIAIISHLDFIDGRTT